METPETVVNQVTVNLVRLDCLANAAADIGSTTTHSEYCCARCNADCLNKSLLIRHFALTHHLKNLLVQQQLVDKKFSSMCPKKYSKNYKLSMHLQSQHGMSDWGSYQQAFAWIRQYYKLLYQKMNYIIRGRISLCPQTYSCEDCGRQFTSLTSFTQHSVIHKPPQFSCNLCDRKFFNENGVRLHTRVVHLWKPMKILPARTNLFLCQQCPKSFHTVGELKSHLMNIHQPKGHKCSHCYREFPNEVKLNHHMLKTHSLYVKLDFKCGICQKVFNKEYTLARHSLFHGNPTYPCPQCSLKFYQPNHLHLHVTRAHTVRLSTRAKVNNKQLNYTCAVCCRPFDQKKNLQTHLTIHYCKPQICPVCQQIFNSDESYRRHLRKNHPDFIVGDVVLCDICNRSFVSRDKYLMHRKYHEKPTLSCPNCQRLFYSTWSLVNHSKVHNRPVSSKVSNKTGMFGCAICSKTFSARYLLKKHLRAHFPTVLYCGKCDFQCYRNAQLRRHLQNFHTAG